MTPGEWLAQNGVQAIEIGGIVLIAVDRWVHRQFWTATDLQRKIESHISLELIAHNSEEILRKERAEGLARELNELKAEMKKLHDRASDYGDEQTKTLGRIYERLIKLESNVAEIFKEIDRRRSSRS